MFMAIIFSDFEVMFIDKAFGTTIKTLVIENMAIDDGTQSVYSLNKLRIQHSNAYSDFFKKFTFSDAVVNMKECIEKNYQYLDIDKMLLICAYRLEERIEKGDLTSEIHPLVQIIYDNISAKAKDKVFSLNLYLNDGKDNWELKEVKYSAERIKRFLSKFTKDSYLTEGEIEEKRNLIQSGKLTLFDTKRQLNNLAFTDEQLEDVAFLSDENFAYVAFRLEWNRDKIIESIKQRKVCSGQLLDTFIKKNKIESIDVTNLYLDGFVSIEHINELKKYSKKNEFDKIVDSHELVKYCVKGIQEGATEEDKQKYNRYVELYKTIKLLNKQEIKYDIGKQNKEIETEDTEIQDTIAELMEIVLEYYNQDDNQKYINIQGDLYIKGILSIDDLKEWNKENKEDFEGIFSQLYMRNKITLAQIRELIDQKKLDFKYMSKLAATEELEREKRMEVLNQGWIDEEDIYILFLNDYINEDDLLHLANLSIIDKPKSESLIRNKNNPDNSQFEIAISGDLKKIKYDSDGNSTNEINNIAPEEENRIIINPNERLEYFDLLGAKKVEHVRIPKDSPFYEYEFFALPDKNGEFSDDSVVIAERFYEETVEHIKQKIDAERKKQSNGEQHSEPKEHLLKYATDNATYFFRGRDILALEGYTNKSEAIDNDGIIFKVDHNLADDSRVGSWASGVLYAITKAMLSNNFKGLTKKEQREIIVDTMKKYYGDKKFMDILDKGTKIDRGEHNGDITEEYEDIVL